MEESFGSKVINLLGFPAIILVIVCVILSFSDTKPYKPQPRPIGPETWEEHVYDVYEKASDSLDKDAKSPKWK
jgi:hypothetical protein